MNKQATFLGVFFLLAVQCTVLPAQQFANDLALMKSANTVHDKKQANQKLKKDFKQVISAYNPISLTLNGMLTLYQKVVSPQISADCLYETSCSRFSRKAIGKFGTIKGVFLSADRLSRCNRISATTIHPSRFNASYRVKDEPFLYSVKYHHKTTH